MFTGLTHHRTVVPALLLGVVGCAGSGTRHETTDVFASTPTQTVVHADDWQPAGVDRPHDQIQLAHQEQLMAPAIDGNSAVDGESLESLVAAALAANQRLQQLRHEADAAWEKIRYADALPDPTVGANIFEDPIETAAGSLRANLTVSQMIPWLHRLQAQEEQAAYEAMALYQLWRAERLKTTAEVKAVYYRLYVIGQELLATESNRVLVKGIVGRAVSLTRQPGVGSAGDVTLGNLALSRLEESRVMLEAKRDMATARLNRLLDRPADAPVNMPTELLVDYEPWSFEGLRQLALERQPEIAAAQLQAHATTWGVEVAALRARPDVAFSFGWQFIDDNRPPSNVVNVGQDAWSLGSTVTVPLWHEKNSAVRDEAVRRHYAAHAATEDLINRYEERLLKLLAEATSASETASLYKETMLGQAEQTLETDSTSYSQGRVEFGRVIDDTRALLDLQVDYHRALGRLAETIARLEQAVASDLTPAAEAGPF